MHLGMFDDLWSAASLVPAAREDGLDIFLVGNRNCPPFVRGSATTLSCSLFERSGKRLLLDGHVNPSHTRGSWASWEATVHAPPPWSAAPMGCSSQIVVTAAPVQDASGPHLLLPEPATLTCVIAFSLGAPCEVLFSHVTSPRKTNSNTATCRFQYNRRRPCQTISDALC